MLAVVWTGHQSKVFILISSSGKWTSENILEVLEFYGSEFLGVIP